nr:trihelix transcription factor PTL-like [Ipomoea batatas]
MDIDAAAAGLGCDGGNGRWPRQETLTLLEIRSRLDPKFKEANQKGPLWDEVSRIMCEEHGYQRSGKKCREKFENLYKYYKKTKEGKAGRQDGKHYRFFRQLEALYGEPSNSGSVSETHHAQSNFPYTNAAVAANNTAQDPAAAAFLHDSKDFIDGQMRKLMEKQEAWLDKIMKTIEHKEEERMLREEEWRKQEASRMEREQKFWANERAWIEARDSALMEALHKNNNNGGSYCPENHQPINPAINDSCFRLLMGDNAENLWENYGLKLSKGGGDDEK